ncbi:MAG: TlpA family protein disulfide reductase [Candidatus Neomarinimicrobiota bacterium]
MSIAGTIINPVNDTVMINYTDTTYTVTLNDNGQFYIELSQDSAQYATLVHGEMTTIFLKPGDGIKISFNTDEFDETMNFQNSPESSFLAYKLISTEQRDFYGENLYLLDESDYKDDLVHYENTMMERLNTFENGYFKSTEIKKLETEIARFTKQKESFSERSKLELEYMWNTQLLYREYNFYSLIENSDRADYVDKLTEFKSKMLQSLERLKDDEDYEKEREKIMAVVGKWEERKNDYDNMPNDGDLSIDFSYPNQSEELISLSSFRGSIVYVDVWATWCGPCIAEIPSLERLQKDYQDKNIVFLSVSVDTDKNAWEKMLIDDELGGVQLWADGWSELTKSYAIFGIPRFMLIDKTGHLISVDAPRPSSNEIRTLIEERI